MTSAAQTMVNVMKAPLLLAASLAATAWMGCAPLGGAGAATSPSQECVERALRNAPLEEVLPDARAHFERQCETTEPGACSTLGVMYELGLGGPRDGRRAVTLYEHACQRGNARGCLNLGLALLEGIGAPRDPERAVTVFAAGCREKFAPACGALGELYQQGRGVAPAPNLAIGLFRRACDGGHLPSCVDLGNLLELEDAAGSVVERIALFERACVGGDPRGCERLGGGAAPPPPRADAELPRTEHTFSIR